LNQLTHRLANAVALSLEVTALFLQIAFITGDLL
jgi:hypothetical protein